PQPFIPFLNGFPTPSGRLEFLSQRAAADGLDALTGYTPPQELPDAGLAQRYPLSLIATASHFFVNTIFSNKPELARRAGPLQVIVHPDDASQRGLADGQIARVFNDRGSFTARVLVSELVRPGVVASTKGYWLKMIRGQNVNVTVDER